MTPGGCPTSWFACSKFNFHHREMASRDDKMPWNLSGDVPSIYLIEHQTMMQKNEISVPEPFTELLWKKQFTFLSLNFFVCIMAIITSINYYSLWANSSLLSQIVNKVLLDHGVCLSRNCLWLLLYTTPSELSDREHPAKSNILNYLTLYGKCADSYTNKLLWETNKITDLEVLCKLQIFM